MEYNFSEIKEFTDLLEKNPADWEWQTKKWLQLRVFAQAQTEAINNLASSDSAEPMDVTEISCMAEVYRSTINNHLRQIDLQQAKKFFEAYNARKRFVCKVQCRLAHHFWRSLLRRKNEGEEAESKSYARFNQKFSLEELAAVACYRYVEKGLGDETAAKKYFFS